MGQRISVELIDDIHGQAADEAVSLTLDGSAYEIDLSSKNADKMRRDLTSFIGHARKVGKTSGVARRSKPASDGPSAVEMRTWAQGNDHEVPGRGRIPRVVRDAFESAD